MIDRGERGKQPSVFMLLDRLRISYTHNGYPAANEERMKLFAPIALAAYGRYASADNNEIGTIFVSFCSLIQGELLSEPEEEERESEGSEEKKVCLKLTNFISKRTSKSKCESNTKRYT